MNYPEAIELLLSLPDLERKGSGPLARSMSLEAMKALLEELGNPQAGRRTIHVTGSKGKGSTSAYTAALLDALGFSTALYSSPHLHDYTERISFNLKPVEQQVFADAVGRISNALIKIHESDKGPLSTFGALTALFFLLARDRNVDWQVVEVGMGGEFDATNVFSEKEAAVITPISLEHTAALGSSVTAIASNKAGIITSGAKVVLSVQSDPAVDTVIRDRCNASGNQLIQVASSYRIEDFAADSFNRQRFKLTGAGKTRTITLAMPGNHQQQNFATAVAVVESLGFDTTDDIISKSAETVIPGRLETVYTGPTVLVDGAHNGESARVLVAALRQHFAFARCIFVVGVNADKQINEILKALQTLPSILIATRSGSEKAMPPEEIQEAAAEFFPAVELQPDSHAALKRALAVADVTDLICVTGSLYLVAEAREYFGLSLAVLNS